MAMDTDPAQMADKALLGELRKGYARKERGTFAQFKRHRLVLAEATKRMGHDEVFRRLKVSP